VHRLLAQPFDWVSLRMARRTVREEAFSAAKLREAEQLLHRSDFGGGDTVVAPSDLMPGNDGRFRFRSPLPSPWPANNYVNGQFFRAPSRSAVVLVHGWNAETGYHTLFPFLARRFAAAGINAVIFELPYHGRRRPAAATGVPSNFLSGDLLHVATAARQAVLDTRAVIAWLRAQGCERIGLWGISLGAWLTGMVVTVERGLSAAVLMTPVSRLDRVIAEAHFCAPIRRSLNGARPDISPLNLMARRPLLAPERLLLVASEHDLFAPIATVEELRAAWGGPVTWRTRHGHISVLLSLPVMNRTIRWLVSQQTAVQTPCTTRR
jgi:pimeloyl-ACP methyl ester carboxylesterase